MNNKLITVYIGYDDIPTAILPLLTFTVTEFNQKIKHNVPQIHTTLTSAVSAYYYDYKDDGWDIKVVHNGKHILFSELLGDVEGNRSFGRAIRITQNWEKMLYSGCFDIDIDN